MHRILALAALLAALPSHALTLDWVVVSDPGNPPDAGPNCTEANCGSVPATYQIGRYEVTNAQYAEFLDAVAAADPNGLYNPGMDTDARGGITRSGSSGSFAYAVKAGRADEPVVFVSFYDALRFTNWLHNAQPTGAQAAGTTEDGAYTITPGGVAANSIVRNPDALFVVPGENEWYKAAYYDPDLMLYYDTPTGTNLAPVSEPPPGGSNSANVWEGSYALTGSASFDDGFDYLTQVGAYASASSPYGTFDQAGNVWEWIETIDGTFRLVRGGGWDDNPTYVSASISAPYAPDTEAYDLGFRVAPEPGGILLALTGALALASARRGQRRKR